MQQIATMRILSLEYEVDYSLIGIHSAEKGYRLAFLLNKCVETFFKKADVNKEFEVFEFEDSHNFVTFFLIKNKYVSDAKTISTGIFKEEIQEIKYVIPERKKIDFFLKIDDCDSVLLQKILTKIKSIDEINTSYEIDLQTLKFKDNLIF